MLKYPRLSYSCLMLLALIGLSCLCASSSWAQTGKPPMEISDEALEIHQSGKLFDGHNDLPWAMRRAAGSSFDKLDIAKPTPLHTDIPRLRAGGLKAQFWSAYVPASTDAAGNALLLTLEQIQLVHDMCARYPDVFEMADTAEDVQRIIADGKIASMIGVEGGHSIENSLQVLRMLHEKGVRYMTLTHSKTLAWADSATDEPKNNGLSPFGQEVVREMNRIGMLVDLSHVSEKCMKDALAISKAPVIFSHSSARAICDHPRNVPDDVLKLTAENGGVVMVNFMSGYVVPTDESERIDVLATKGTVSPERAKKMKRGDVKIVCDHIEHIIKVAGIDHVGIGSDYDGVSQLPVGLDDVSYYPNLTQELLDRGYKKEQIHKILGDNVIRVLAKSEQVAQKLKSGELAFPPLGQTNQQELFRLTVEAGEFDRTQTIVETPIKFKGTPPESVTLADAQGNQFFGQIFPVTPVPPMDDDAPAAANDQPNDSKIETADAESAEATYQLQFVLPKLGKGESVELVATASGLNPSRSYAWGEVDPGVTELSYGDQPVVRYMHEAVDNSSDQRRAETYKVFHHVYAPDGKRLLTKGPGGLFPHHRGLFYGFNRISYGDQQADVWHCSKGESQSHMQTLGLTAGSVFGRDVNEIQWRGQDDQPFVVEIREMTTHRIGNSTVIDFHSTLNNVIDQEIKFRGDPQHAGFQFRASQAVPDHAQHMTYYIRPDGIGKPGEFRNWSDKEDETESNRNHINLAWHAMCIAMPKLQVNEDDPGPTGKLDPADVDKFTICYLDSPENPKPSRFSERDYGRFGSYFEYDLKPEKSFEVHYRVVVQPGELTVQQINSMSEDFVHPVTVTQSPVTDSPPAVR